MADNGIVFDTLATDSQVVLPDDISIVITRAVYEEHLRAFNALKTQIDVNIGPTVANFQSAMAAIGAHINNKPDQDSVSKILLHLDSNNNELFARRIHEHTKSQITDFAHTHTTTDIVGLDAVLALKADKEHVPAENAEKDATNDHDKRYITRRELRNAGIYESVLEAADGVTHDLDTLKTQGNYSFKSTSTAPSNAPAYKQGTMTVMKTANGDVHQIFYADNGNVYTRLYDASASEWITWYRVNGPSRVKSDDFESSGTAYTLDCLYYDIANISMNNNCTLRLTNLEKGMQAFVFVDKNPSYTLTYNNLAVLTTEDSGTFRLEFQNSGSGIKLINVMAILA